ncbi:hypothetical protein [Glycomyces harbinensis]|uniref:Uncharacterized protein n=1 Tax=Glycomyces harbinensis TaxID=58114 RepID=A0A1G7CWJ2_9ACTN|nr:hypothetical protein [Glycomyces harbinensis]SDE43678.1 hypothetical protein SAMN05216270_12175 [Glycomyces harbinensis]
MSRDLPELEFNRGEAFLRMDEAVAQTIEGLPNFPGFQQRTTLKLECAEEGRESYEVNYTFPEETIGSDLVTKEYFAVLKEYWPSIGWEVHGERDDVDGDIADIQATRPDGVNVWYSNVLGQIVIHSQVACIEPEGEPVCGPPLGGVTPENDSTKDCVIETPEESESESVDAIAPFRGAGAAMIPWSRESGPGETGHGSFRQ